MGNTSSTSSTTSSSGVPVHKSLRHRKASLDLPDLAAMYDTVQTRSSPWSIPVRAPEREEPVYVQPMHHIENNLGRRVQEQPETPISSVDSFPRTLSFHPVAPPPSRTTTSETLTIRSSLPMVLDIDTIPEAVEASVGLFDRKIYWHGKAASVFVVHTADNVSVRTLMDSVSPTSFSISVAFPPGTHHIRFLVDDQWRVTDDLPKAVDDAGNLANYIHMDPPYDPNNPQSNRITPPRSPLGAHIIVTSLPPLQGNNLASLGRLSLGQSFWSSSSEHDRDSSSADEQAALSRYTPRWTTDIPLELIRAAKEEQVYIDYAQKTPARRPGESQVQQGFIPLPNVPPAPSLPRYLEKLILNQGFTHTVGHDRRHKDKRGSRENIGREDYIHRSGVGLPLPVTTASGTDITAGLGVRAPEIAGTERMLPVMEAIEGGELDPTSPRAVAALATFATISDDSSVLPVPSHVVLHHVCTSTIKEGVLAVASTVRYRKKYLTTVFYKPA
ncbi:5'-AMP-activated protein kinase beta subunit, interation domain-containing protein [Lentinula aciculospora]|uniref:5'-AMP-activated protein kinase beta subunit, interation domain-containing protein n=1 Tax=Lentinula aciculospora TaxID=153920 RepID=A0A9W9ABC5_9AGAR|nr:5'-AMP-activated protein kinase beta subunit, interation domain-containing protein [Lentinula aciculospora]